jgi:hypothetical protein
MGILKTVTNKLRDLGVLSKFSDDEMLDAFTEDKLREHDEAVKQIRNVTASRQQTNNRLRAQLVRAKRSAAFAEFERDIRKEHH